MGLYHKCNGSRIRKPTFQNFPCMKSSNVKLSDISLVSSITTKHELGTDGQHMKRPELDAFLEYLRGTSFEVVLFTDELSFVIFSASFIK